MANNTQFDESWFMQAYAEHEAALRAYARSLLPTWDAVDDTLQEASIIMWRKIDQLQSADEFLPWAKVILRFEALKARRKVARDRHVFSEKLFEMLAEEGEHERDATSIQQAALQTCLAKMSEPNRELVMAPYTRDNAVVDLAKESGRTVNSLYKLLGRLRTKLRKCVHENMTDPKEALA
jgi:RNA polymerase sigma-70 factor (ECF subfamily)